MEITFEIVKESGKYFLKASNWVGGGDKLMTIYKANSENPFVRMYGEKWFLSDEDKEALAALIA